MQAIPEILIETFHYFSWLNPLLDLGQKRMLEENDMYNILPEDQAEILGEELQRYLNTSSDVQMSRSESERCCSHECYFLLTNFLVLMIVPFEDLEPDGRLRRRGLVLRPLNLPATGSCRIKTSTSFLQVLGL